MHAHDIRLRWEILISRQGLSRSDIKKKKYLSTRYTISNTDQCLPTVPSASTC